MELTNEDVADILALLDSLPYDELDLQTSRFRLTLRRTPDGWTQSTALLSEPVRAATMAQRGGYDHTDGPSLRGGGAADAAQAGAGGTETVNEPDDAAEDDRGRRGDAAGAAAAGRGELVAVRAPLPGIFYRAPRPGAGPFVEVGSRVSEDTVVGIVETMKLMNSVHAGARGTVAEICLGNAQFAAQGATLMRVRADPGEQAP